MNEDKFASLSSGLLARKGAAKPAMRRQGFVNPAGDMHDLHDDLGWNDMGYEAPRPVGEEHRNGFVTDGPRPSPWVRIQQDALAKDFALPGEEPAEEESSDEALRFDPPVAPDVSDEPVSEIDPLEHGRGWPLSPSDEEASVPAIEADEGDDAAAPVEPLAQPAPVEADGPLTAVPDAGFDEPEEPSERAIIVPFHNSSEQMRDHVREAMLARDKAAFTLRLDPERHLRLRLASAVSRRSSQQLVTEALDQFLAAMPELDQIAERLPRGKAAARN